jgi:molybdopterin-guanine dinucleotide biosynthesis protein
MENAVPVAGVAGGASSGKSTVCKMIIDQLRDQRVVVVTQVGTLQLWLRFPPPRLVLRASYKHSSLALLSLLRDAKI